MYSKRVILPLIFSITVVVLLVIMLSVRYQLGLMRYFDMDEFAYLFWSRQMTLGNIPYKDFFLFQTPGYLWVLAPLFLLVKGAGIFIAARVLSFVAFVLLLASGSLLYWETRRSWTVVFFPLFLTFLPMPSDKFLESRPDTLSLAICLFGVWILVQWATGRIKKHIPFFLFVSGVLLSVSVVVFPKVVPLIGVVILCMSAILIQKIRTKSLPFQKIFRDGGALVVGGLSVVLFVFCWAFFQTGDLSMFLYSVTTMAVEASQLGRLFPLPPLFFFIPNDVYYGVGGWHIGVVVNHAFWIVGSVIALLRLITITSIKRWDNQCIECIFLFIFLLYVMLFLFYFPLKHSQYLIIPAVFVCFYATDGVRVMWETMKKKPVGIGIFLLFTGLILYGVWSGFQTVTMPKFSWVNTFTLQRFDQIHALIPPNEPVFDMVGMTLDYPLGFFVSGYPFGQFAHFLSRPIPNFVSQMTERNVKYIFQGDAKRTAALTPSDQAWVHANFTEVGNGDLLVRKDMSR